MTEIQKQIDELTKKLHKGSVDAYKQLETIRTITFNIKILVAHLAETDSTRGLDKIGDILNDSLLRLENSTESVKEISKEIAELNKQVNIKGDDYCRESK